MNNFCTYFDWNYALRGLTLYRSLTQHLKDFKLFVLCLDDRTYDLLQLNKYKNIVPIHLRQLEKKYVELEEAKQNRSLIEYYFTLSPILPLYILETNINLDYITYMDADLFFYSDIKPIFKEFALNSILLIEHRFSDKLKHLNEFGSYNVQFMTFKNDNNAKICLKWWKDQCLSWCYDRLENGKFADQKYLDDWTSRFNGVHVLKYKGAGLAPWNWMNYNITVNEDNSVTVDDDKLIFYHFHGLKIISEHLIISGIGHYKAGMDRQIKNILYKKYMQELKVTKSLIDTCKSDNHKLILKDMRYGRSTFRLLLSGIKHNNLMWI